jgi:MFS family permease
MKALLGAPFRSRRVRDAATYSFRLGPPGEKWSSTPFGGLAIVHSLSSVGDAMVTVALAGSVFVSVSLHAARGRTALGLLCTVLPFAVVGPFVGPAIDRVRGGRKFIVFLSAIGRMAACLMMASWIHSLLLFPAAFLSLVCSKTFAVAKASLVPGVVDNQEHLVRANSKLAVASSIFSSLGAAFGSVVYRLMGSRVLLDVDLLVFATLAGLSLYMLSGSREPVGPVDAGPGIPEGDGSPLPLSGLAARLGVLRRKPRARIPRDLALAQIAMAGMRCAAGFLTALVVFAFRREGAPIIWYGLVAVASVGGNFSGALVAPWLKDRVSEKRLVAAAALVIGAVAVGATQLTGAHYRPAALLLAIVVGLGASVAKTAFDAIVQRETRDTDRSRLFARFESIFQLAWVVGALVPTLIATSLLAGFIIIACGVIISSATFVFGVARDRGRPTMVAAPGPPEAAPAGWGAAPEPFSPPVPPPPLA